MIPILASFLTNMLVSFIFLFLHIFSYSFIKMVSEFFAPKCIVPEKSEVQRNLFPYSPEIVRLKNVIYEAYNSKWGTKFLVLLRGVPGSGKSTLAR